MTGWRMDGRTLTSMQRLGMTIAALGDFLWHGIAWVHLARKKGRSLEAPLQNGTTIDSLPIPRV